MANERVSQLPDLFATDMQPDDLFLVTDVSMKESKRMNMGELLSYIEGSGSFDAAHSTLADTASYIEPSAIDGTVATALNASRSVSSSAADNARSSSYSLNADTASYAAFCVVSQDTANSSSYLIFTPGVFNGSASYAVQALNANVSTTTLNLTYTGTPNGTASFAISSSAVVTSSYSVTSSFSNNAGFAVTASHALVSDNTVQSISSSYANQADNAATASFISNAFYGPKFITPITIRTSTAAVPWTQFVCPVPTIPIGTRTIIVDAFTDNNGTPNSSFVQIAQQSSTTASAAYIVTAYRTSGAGDHCTFGGQATGPCSSSNSNSSSFYYTFTGNASGGTVLRLIGYY